MHLIGHADLNINHVVVPNRVANQLQDEASKHRSVPEGFLLREQHLPSLRALPQWVTDGHGQAEKGPDGAGSALLYRPGRGRH